MANNRSYNFNSPYGNQNPTYTSNSNPAQHQQIRQGQQQRHQTPNADMSFGQPQQALQAPVQVDPALLEQLMQQPDYQQTSQLQIARPAQVGLQTIQLTPFEQHTVIVARQRMAKVRARQQYRQRQQQRPLLPRTQDLQRARQGLQQQQQTLVRQQPPARQYPTTKPRHNVGPGDLGYDKGQKFIDNLRKKIQRVEQNLSLEMPKLEFSIRNWIYQYPAHWRTFTLELEPRYDQIVAEQARLRAAPPVPTINPAIRGAEAFNGSANQTRSPLAAINLSNSIHGTAAFGEQTQQHVTSQQQQHWQQQHQHSFTQPTTSPAPQLHQYRVSLPPSYQPASSPQAHTQMRSEVPPPEQPADEGTTPSSPPPAYETLHAVERG